MTIFPDGKRERGLIAYLQGLAYRVTMRVAHRFNWHYAPAGGPEGDMHWCHWCGLRGKVIPPLRATDEIVNYIERRTHEKVDDQAKICAVCEPQEPEAGDGR